VAEPACPLNGMITIFHAAAGGPLLVD
jgi:hypothetical protein